MRGLRWAALAALLVAHGAIADDRVLDSFDPVAGWTATSSEGASVEIAQDTGRDGMAMRIDFEFPPGGGFVTVHKEFPFALPDNYAFSFDLRADAPTNNFEFKVIDPSSRNVWWRNQRDFVFPREWQRMTIRKSRLAFAWGPLAGGTPRKVGALELSISTGSGGKGSVWVDDLRFEERETASRYNRNAKVTASTSVPDHDPAAVLDGNPETSWKSGSLAGDQWLMLDFLKQREYGGLLIDWDAEDYATSYEVQISDDGETWTTASSSTLANGGRDYVYMPDAESRYIRLQLRQSSRGQGYGIHSITVEPFEFSATPNQFFEAVAREAPPGTYPKYFYGQQTYWTVIGVNGDEKEALLDQQGMVETEKGGFSIEPFVYVGGELLRWNNVETRPMLDEGDLPIPSVVWRHDRITLTVTAFADGPAGESTLWIRYRLENVRDEVEHASLFLAIRPFQVNPPWQSLNMSGGVAMIRELSFDGKVVRVNGNKVIVPSAAPDRFGASGFEQGMVTEFLLKDEVPTQLEASDPFGFASGALEYGVDLAPGGGLEVSPIDQRYWERSGVLCSVDARRL